MSREQAGIFRYVVAGNAIEYVVLDYKYIKNIWSRNIKSLNLHEYALLKSYEKEHIAGFAGAHADGHRM
jgi:hypothetical protein